MSTCDFCDNPAVYHEIRASGGTTEEVHLCAEHAAEAGLQIGDGGLGISLSLSESIPAVSPQACPACGMSIADFKKTSLMGCDECYNTFESHLEPLVSRIQTGTQHVGKAPINAGLDVDRQLTLQRLMRELDMAVSSEHYERAAELRDELRRVREEEDDS